MPPTVPTSFVPKQPVTPGRRRTSGTNPFLAIALFILGAMVIGCGAVFGYNYFLQKVAKSKAEQVVAAQNKIDQGTVTQFIRLRDRFTAAKSVLDHQIAMSQFLDVIENLTLQNVRFSSLQVTVKQERQATVTMAGTARSFNALAAESAALASDKRIKRAIFSGISVKDGNSVGFNLTAELDPSLVIRSLSTVTSAPAPTPVSTTTPVSTATTTKP
jgi:hypothetical protein